MIEAWEFSPPADPAVMRVWSPDPDLNIDVLWTRSYVYANLGTLVRPYSNWTLTHWRPAGAKMWRRVK